MANAVRIEGPLDARALERALSEVVGRHEALRTSFQEAPDGPVAMFAPAMQVRLAVEELPAIGGEERHRQAAACAAAEARTPFDLERGPLLRARLLRFAPDDHVLILVLHHVVSDGWSMGVLVRELAAAYAAFRDGRPPQLPALAGAVPRLGGVAARVVGRRRDGPPNRLLAHAAARSRTARAARRSTTSRAR